MAWNDDIFGWAILFFLVTLGFPNLVLVTMLIEIIVMIEEVATSRSETHDLIEGKQRPSEAHKLGSSKVSLSPASEVVRFTHATANWTGWTHWATMRLKREYAP
jgi:hypothetical protein